ncbi:AAA family ATPase [Streptomyces libani]
MFAELYSAAGLYVRRGNVGDDALSGDGHGIHVVRRCSRPSKYCGECALPRVEEVCLRFFFRGRKSCMGLVERDAVVAELRTALSDSAKGRGKVAVIRGGIASGKTALLRAFEEHAVASGATLLRASGAPSEQSLRFGVIEQFFSGATTPPEASAMLSRLTGLDAPQVGGELSSAAQSGTRDAHDLCVGLLELSRKGPLVITVDDHQFADSASLQVLTYLQHRIGTARVMLLLSQGTEPPSELVAEALRQPYSRQFTLYPLSPEGVGQLLAQRLDSSAALRQAPGSYALTGGNPLLTRALIDDSLAPGPEASAGAADGPVTGQAFTRAVMACLHRGGPQLLRTARAIAVLGEFAAPALLARFLDVRPSVVGGALEALELAGLTIDAQFRYEGTRAAVLDELTPEERSALNRRAAELLHHDGVAPSDVVGYLLAAGEADEPWAARVLHAAADQALPHAEQALALGKVAEAVQYLEFASRSCGDEHKRAMLTARLAWVQWTSSPAAATRHHGPLQTALEKELLSGREVMRLVRSLAWHGRPKEAVRALESLGAPPEGDGSRDQAERKLTRQWLSRWHPQIFAQVERHAAMSEPPGSPGPARRPQTAVLPRGTGNSSAVEGAEQVLQRARVRETPLASVISALHELLAAERFERAMYWCNELLQKAEGQHAAAWRGVLLDTRAAVSLRLGDLADAERDACSALTALSARSWGVAIGSPLSHAVHAATIRGHFRQGRGTPQPDDPAGHDGHPIRAAVPHGSWAFPSRDGPAARRAGGFRGRGRSRGQVEARPSDDPALARGPGPGPRPGRPDRPGQGTHQGPTTHDRAGLHPDAGCLARNSRLGQRSQATAAPARRGGRSAAGRRGPVRTGAGVRRTRSGLADPRQTGPGPADPAPGAATGQELPCRAAVRPTRRDQGAAEQ